MIKRERVRERERERERETMVDILDLPLYSHCFDLALPLAHPPPPSLPP